MHTFKGKTIRVHINSDGSGTAHVDIPTPYVGSPKRQDVSGPELVEFAKWLLSRVGSKGRDYWVNTRVAVVEQGGSCPHGMLSCDYGGNCQGCLRDAWDAGRRSATLVDGALMEALGDVANSVDQDISSPDEESVRAIFRAFGLSLASL